MKKLVLITLLLGGCATTPQKLKCNDYGGALPEVFKNLVPEPGEEPTPYQLTSHTCSSFPIFDMYNNYVRTKIICR